MSFRSYISLQPEDEEVSEEKEIFDEADSDFFKAPLLPGEVVIASANNVLKFDAFSDQKKGVSGSLFCTNFKLSFITAGSSTSSSIWKLKNLLIDSNDVCLSNIDSVFQGCGVKKKKFIPGSSTSGKVKIVEIHCKNFGVHTYSFKFSPLGHGKSIVNAILHHAFPPKIKLMFAFDYKTPVAKRRENVARFTVPADWIAELKRCKCENQWRVSYLNEYFRVCDSLPETFVVPNNPVDAILKHGAPHFTGHRLLKWSWGNKCGNCIIRMAALDPAIIESDQLQIMKTYIQNCHPFQKVPREFTLDDILPNYRELQNSFMKLKSFCIADDATAFWEQDTEFKAGIESSKWLHHVSSFLLVAKNVASTIMYEKTSVILIESDDRDMNCIISSLVQLILDPHYRTVQGFQNLIQKEWVAMGHRFSDRLNQVRNHDNEESPVFLMFLDCVWQLIRQYPTVFEFTETYLAVLWDSTKLVIFETFLFNSAKQRNDALYHTSEAGNVRLQSVWDWSLQFSSEDTELFINPMYVVSYEMHNYMHTVMSKEKRCSKPDFKSNKVQNERQILHKICAWNEESLLDLKVDSLELELWQLCYFRWLPFCQVMNGGSPAVSFQQQKMASEILSSMKCIRDLKVSLSEDVCDKGYFDSSFQFKSSLSKYVLNNNSVSSSFPFSTDVATDHRSGYSMPVLLPKSLSLLTDSNQDFSDLD